MSPWSSFAEHFASNAHRPLPTVEGESGVPPAVRVALARSLAKLQRGETGEGRIAHEIDRFHSPAIDDAYRQALKLFVREEGRHACILGDVVRALDGRVLEDAWAAQLFAGLRGLLGVRFKLLVLLVAEVVGIGFYRALAERLDDGFVRAALDELCADEETHLLFHRAFFQLAAPAGVRRALFSAAWWTIGGAACAALLLDHASTLHALGVPLPRVARRLCALLQEGAAAPVPTRTQSRLT